MSNQHEDTATHQFVEKDKQANSGLFNTFISSCDYNLDSALCLEAKADVGGNLTDNGQMRFCQRGDLV